MKVLDFMVTCIGSGTPFYLACDLLQPLDVALSLRDK